MKVFVYYWEVGKLCTICRFFWCIWNSTMLETLECVVYIHELYNKALLFEGILWRTFATIYKRIWCVWNLDFISLFTCLFLISLLCLLYLSLSLLAFLRRSVKLFWREIILFFISQRHRGKNVVHLHTSEIINVYLRNKEVKSLHFAHSLKRILLRVNGRILGSSTNLIFGTLKPIELTLSSFCVCISRVSEQFIYLYIFLMWGVEAEITSSRFNVDQL